jgi:hypothetical protein
MVKRTREIWTRQDYVSHSYQSCQYELQSEILKGTTSTTGGGTNSMPAGGGHFNEAFL